jgi:hypothetical protein
MSLGGGVSGHMPQSVPLRLKGNGNEIDRLYARRVFNTSASFKTAADPVTSGMLLNGSYRSTMNAGDPLNRANQQCGGSNQASGAVRGSANAAARDHLAGGLADGACGTTTQYGGAPYVALHTQNPVWSGNSRFVVDSSDFTRFKKMKSVNRNYNDLTFGGDDHFAAQMAINRVRR